MKLKRLWILLFLTLPIFALAQNDRIQQISIEPLTIGTSPFPHRVPMRYERAVSNRWSWMLQGNWDAGVGLGSGDGASGGNLTLAFGGGARFWMLNDRPLTGVFLGLGFTKTILGGYLSSTFGNHPVLDQSLVADLETGYQWMLENGITLGPRFSLGYDDHTGSESVFALGLSVGFAW